MAGTPQGNIGPIVSLGWAGSQISISEGVIFIPWLAVITFALDILELAGIIPDPISLLLSLFSGRPREQATIQQASRLMTARNPAARLFGIMLERMVAEWDIVTSEGGSGREILDAATAEFVANLVAQGIAEERAKVILVNALSEAAQSGLPLEPELKQPLAQNLNFNGPQTMATELMTQYEKQIAKGLSINNALQKAEQWVWKNTNLNNLFHLQIGKFIVPTPPPPTLVPGQNGTCPVGYQLDSKTELCTLISTTPPPPPPPPIPPPPIGGQPDPEGDEITDDLCQQMQANTAALITAIQAIPQPPAEDPDCCTNVVNALSNVVTVLGSVASAIAGISGAGGVDLSGVVAALQQLVTAVGAIPGPAPIDFSPITAALNQIAQQLAKGAGVNLKPIVDALNAIFGTIDTPIALGKQLANDGYVDQAYVSFFGQGATAPMGVAAAFTHDWELIRNLVKNFVGTDIGPPGGAPASPAKGPTGLTGALTTYLSSTDKIISPVLDPLIKTVIGQLAPVGTPSIGNIGVELSTPIKSAVSVALTAAVASWIMSYLGIAGGEPLAIIAELIAGAIGFEELRDVEIAPLVSNGIAKIADMQAKAKFRQELPGAEALFSLVARGLLDSGTVGTIIPFTGIPSQLADATQKSVYGGWQARMMIRMFESGLFTPGDLADELTFAGMRPASQKRLLAAAPWLATVSERNELKAALENAYVNGLLSDSDLTQQLAQLNQDTDGDGMLLQRSQLQKRVSFAKELERSYSAQFTIQLIPESQYRGLLSGLGLQPDWINAKVAQDTAHMAATAYRKELAAELALERATAAEERRAAIKNFVVGNIDQAGLLAALLLTGLNSTQAAAWVDLTTLQKSGSLRWIYGLQLLPAQAALLRSRVTALSDQRKRLQITDPAFVAALQALGIPPHYVNVIRATADAMISPKTAAVTIPVETS